jgi:3-hydroxybutyryl-CoA dehydratase
MTAITPRNSFTIGEKASLSRTVSESDIADFARISGDVNPVHVDEAYAHTTRFGGRIAHGMLTAGFISAVLGTRLPGPGGIYLSQALKFTAPVRAGDTITASAEVVAYREDKRIVTLKTECTNQRGEIVVAGEAVIMMEKGA